jgi:GNAT superfamily N-acetyltransferase
MSFTIRLAGADDRGTVVSFLRAMNPAGDAERRYDWLYRDNPAGPAITWMAVDDASGAVAGVTSFFPWRLWLDGHAVLGALGGDAWVLPSFRRRGIGQLLHAASRAEMAPRGIQCMYGAPGEMNITPLKNGGSHHIGDAVRWARPISARALHAPAGLTWLVDGPVRSLLRPRLGVAKLEPMARGDARVDEVWRAARGDLSLAAVRDAAFYTWRFLDAPAGTQRPYVVVRRGKPIAACAVEELPASLRIVDLCAPAKAWGAALRAIVAFGVEAPEGEARPIVDIRLLAPDGDRRRLWRWGFVRREAKPFLAMVPDGPEHADGSPMLDPSRWFFTGADSDIDTLDEGEGDGEHRARRQAAPAAAHPAATGA